MQLFDVLPTLHEKGTGVKAEERAEIRDDLLERGCMYIMPLMK